VYKHRVMDQRIDVSVSSAVLFFFAGRPTLGRIRVFGSCVEKNSRKFKFVSKIFPFGRSSLDPQSLV